MTNLNSNPGCLGRLLQVLFGGTGSEEKTWPYRRRPYLLSKAEFSFFRVLQPLAAERGWVVCPKVNLGDLLSVAKGTENWQSWRNKIDRKHADFVLCEAETMRPVAVVKLDDASHGSEQARERDAVKDRALGAAGLPVVRVRARRGYAADELRAALAGALAPSPSQGEGGG